MPLITEKPCLERKRKRKFKKRGWEVLELNTAHSLPFQMGAMPVYSGTDLGNQA